jgi:hypothetical protein
MQHKGPSKHPPFGSSWAMVTIGPLSKGQMSPCPLVNDNLCDDEMSRSETRSGHVPTPPSVS